MELNLGHGSGTDTDLLMAIGQTIPVYHPVDGDTRGFITWTSEVFLMKGSVVFWPAASHDPHDHHMRSIISGYFPLIELL